MNQLQLSTEHFDLFIDGGNYIDAPRLFFAYYKQIPNIKILPEINAIRLRKWLEAEGEYKILRKHYRQKYDKDSRSLKHSEAFYILENDLLLHLQYDDLTILHSANQDKLAEDLLFSMRRFTRRTRKNQDISVIFKGHHGLMTAAIKIKKPEINFDLHYNSELMPVHKEILAQVKQENKSGLYLFYGTPGTGKSTYIRYLIRSINKKAIFIPPRLAGNMDSPEFTELLIRNENSLFIIEDAEELLQSRDAGRSSSISMLLNLTDGILGESLNIQVIATFNTELRNIDKALLRKGRLLSMYEFKPLNEEKSKLLAMSLGYHSNVIQKEMTLAEIFNLNSDNFQVYPDQRTKIGFTAA